MRAYLTTLAIVGVLACCMAQEAAKKLRLPIWTFHQKNTTTIGLNMGLASVPSETAREVTTIGVHAEAIGLGVFLLLAGGPVNGGSEEELSERIHGLAISPLGSVCNCLTNGMNLNVGGTYMQFVNGVSVAIGIAQSDRFRGLQGALLNVTQQGIGLQLGALFNDASSLHGVQLAAYNNTKQLRGLQIGLYNRSKDLNGIQIGLWNVNPKRKLPLFNWA